MHDDDAAVDEVVSAAMRWLDDEHEMHDTPSMTAFMRCPTDETVWLHAYPAQMMVIETYPACRAPGYSTAILGGTIQRFPVPKIEGAVAAMFAERMYALAQAGYINARPEGGR